MKLLIISNMPHYYHQDQLVGWGPTVQEIDVLATAFDQIVHLGCLYSGQAPLSALPYKAGNIQFVPLQPAGGESLRSKLDVLRRLPSYIRAIQKWLPWGDVVHIRCPANIGLVALLLLSFSSRPTRRWVKYAGNWKPEGSEAWSYTLQRRILEGPFYRGLVTVNGEWPDQPHHVYSFNNPCLTTPEKAVAAKITSNKELKPPYRLLFVGRIEASKGLGNILKIASKLHEHKIPFDLDLLGDGPERMNFEGMASDLGLSSRVHFHGWLPRYALNDFYSHAHFMLLPSTASEGWPKVLSEAMAYGVVPLASTISSIPQMLDQTQAGFAIPQAHIDQYVSVILQLISNVTAWKTMSRAGVKAADLFTYDNYLMSVDRMFSSNWHFNINLPERIS